MSDSALELTHQNLSLVMELTATVPKRKNYTSRILTRLFCSDFVFTPNLANLVDAESLYVAMQVHCVLACLKFGTSPIFMTSGTYYQPGIMFVRHVTLHYAVIHSIMSSDKILEHWSSYWQRCAFKKFFFAVQ